MAQKWSSSSTWVSRQMSPQTPSAPPIRSSLLLLHIPTPPLPPPPLTTSPSSTTSSPLPTPPPANRHPECGLGRSYQRRSRYRSGCGRGPLTRWSGRTATSPAPPPLPPPLGPPGSGKASLAASFPRHRFLPFSAVSAGVKDARDAVDDAHKSRLIGATVATVLFVDEVHRFNKAQQDSFLPSIEDGSIVFLGATTENPSFHIVTPLLSRCRILKPNPLVPTDIAGLLCRPADDGERGLRLSIGPCPHHHHRRRGLRFLVTPLRWRR